MLKTYLSNSLINGDKTTTENRISVWDGWRGIAIFFVLCGHFYDIEWLWEDRLGVDVFFVLSGMLMSQILFEKRLSLKDFYIRRLSRIYPVLFVYVVSIYLFSWTQNISFNVSEIFSSLAFLRTYYPTDPNIWSSGVSIGHLWSLNVEEHAYVILSLLSVLLVTRKNIAALLLSLALCSMLLSFYNYSRLPAEDFKLYLIRTECAVVFIFFSAGYSLLKRQKHWTGSTILAPLCVSVSLLCYSESLPIWLTFSVSPILLAIAVNHLDNIPHALKYVLSLTPLRYLGLFSYSIYIWQQFFFEYHWIFPLPKTIVALFAITVGILSYYFLENPVRNLINKRWSSNPTYRTTGTSTTKS